MGARRPGRRHPARHDAAAAASRWQHALDRMEPFLDMVTATTARGRPPGGGVRSPDAPGAAWVTAARPGGPAGSP